MIKIIDFFFYSQTFNLNWRYYNDYLYIRIIRETLIRITNLLLLLMVTLFILPASAIMYASGSTEDNSEGCSILLNSLCNSESGSTEDNSDSSSSGSTDTGDSPPSDFLPDNVDSSSSGSTDDNADSSTTVTENNSTLPSGSPLGNNTVNVQGEDLVSSVLAMQNQERAAVGVPPLTWSDTIAASAQTWADHVLATSDSTHSTGTGYGENIAWGGGPSYATLAVLQQGWINEKNNYVPGTPWSYATGHYTAIVDKRSTEVGCGFTSGPGGPYAEYGGTNVLVCQYNPPGNWNNQPPY